MKFQKVIGFGPEVDHWIRNLRGSAKMTSDFYEHQQSLRNIKFNEILMSISNFQKIIGFGTELHCWIPHWRGSAKMCSDFSDHHQSLRNIRFNEIKATL